jgi:hypothetical protein
MAKKTQLNPSKIKLPPGHCWESVADWKNKTKNGKPVPIAGMAVTGFVERTVQDVRLYNRIQQQRPRRNDSAIGYCPCSPQIQRSMPVGKLKPLHALGQLFDCSVCRPKTKQRPKGEKVRVTTSGKPSDKVMAQFKRMTPDQQRSVKAVIRRRQVAMAKLDIKHDDAAFDRVLIEAIEIVKLEEREPKQEDTRIKEPFRSYDIYASPTMDNL